MKRIPLVKVQPVLLAFGLGCLGPTALAGTVPTVTLVFGDDTGDEAGQDPVQFTLTRSNDAGTAMQLRVYLEILGTADPNADYSRPGVSAVTSTKFFTTIPAGQLSHTVTLTPDRDNRIEGEEQIVVSVLPWELVDNEYVIGTPSAGEATIADDVAVVTLDVNDNEAAELGQDAAAITVTRSDNGDVASSLRVYMELSGSAQRGPDYQTSGLSAAGGSVYFATIPADEFSRLITLTPDFDFVAEGDETAVLTLVATQQASSAYLIGGPSEGSITIEDHVELIFADGFEDLPP